MTVPSKKDYITMSYEYNLIPVISEHLLDTETPMSIFFKIKQAGYKNTFLLESVEGGKLGQYSFIGFDPWMTYTSKNCLGQVILLGKNLSRNGPPTKVLASLLNEYRLPDMSETNHFYGGAVGYFAYDIIRSLERLPQVPPDHLNLPDCLVMFARTIIVFDHVRNIVKIITLSHPGNNPERKYKQAVTHIENIFRLIKDNVVIKPLDNSFNISLKKVKLSITKKQYLNKVKKALNYIRAGDIFQVVLSRRYSIPYQSNPLDTYRRLRSINPSPYMLYLEYGDTVILGASPEMLVRISNSTVHTRPIAGTRPRTHNQLIDRKLEQELKKDKKENAEHLMLVDLSRNDLGKVCVPGSIRVPDFMFVEKFSHVMHLVSNVTGTLEQGKTPLDAFEACFPAGTVSGAPKIRAMKIIDELETCKRSIYAGAVGYAGFGGILDTAIAIRTMIITGGYAHIQVGSGIVAGSIPEKEYIETVNKAAALLQVLGIEDEQAVISLEG